MRRIAKAALVAPALALSACYHAVIDTGRPAGSTVITKSFQPGFVWGLVPPPPLNVAGQLQLKGANVSVFDPKAMENSRKVFPTLTYATSIADAAAHADAVLVLTEWNE